MVYNLSLRILHDPDDAQDASQEAFLKCYRNLSQFRGDSRFSVWLYRLTYNICLDMLRRQKRSNVISLHASDDDEEDPLADIPTSEAGPAERLEQKERIAALRRALAAISEEHREILLMREIDGLSYDEIADALGVSLGTVKSRINRARLALRKELQQSGNFSFYETSNTMKGGSDI